MMTSAEESLLKLALTSDWSTYERAFAQVLAERTPDGMFLPADNSRIVSKPSRKANAVHSRGHFKYQFEVDGGRFNAIIEFYHSGNYMAVNILKAGILGGSTFSLNSGSKQYFTSKVDKPEYLSGSIWQNCVHELLQKLRQHEENLPSFIADYVKIQREEAERVAQERERRTLKKAAMRVGVFHKFKVRSTPETELLFQVCSRMGTEKSVFKAFGDLLPLITGEKIDGTE
jgi:hypothetical protein